MLLQDLDSTLTTDWQCTPQRYHVVLTTICAIDAAGDVEGALAQLPRYLAAERAVLEVQYVAAHHIRLTDVADVTDVTSRP